MHSSQAAQPAACLHTDRYPPLSIASLARQGRKGFKGFVKAAKRPGEEEDEGGEEEQQAQQQQRQEPKPKQKEPKPKAAAAKPAPTKSEEPVSDDGSGENDEGDEGGPETRGKMLQRHKKVST